MPCKDITEVIEVTLDAEDRLSAYRFVKRTCGQGVGVASLLIDQLAGMTVDDILEISPEAFLETHPVADPLEEFLGLKHLIALQSTLEVYVGEEAGGPDALCAAAEIIFDAGETSIQAVIRVDLVTEAIKSCGNCRGCGTSHGKVKLAKPVFN